MWCHPSSSCTSLVLALFSSRRLNALGMNLWDDFLYFHRNHAPEAGIFLASEKIVKALEFSDIRDFMGEIALKMKQVGKVSKDFVLNFSQRSRYFLWEIFLLGRYLTYEQVWVERDCGCFCCDNFVSSKFLELSQKISIVKLLEIYFCNICAIVHFR